MSYQPRFLAYLKYTGKEPDNVKMHEFQNWIFQHLEIFKKEQNINNNMTHEQHEEFTVFLFNIKGGRMMDWREAEKYLYTIKESYEKIGWIGSFALSMTINPLVKRFKNGERTRDLFDEIYNLK